MNLAVTKALRGLMQPAQCGRSQPRRKTQRVKFKWEVKPMEKTPLVYNPAPVDDWDEYKARELAQELALQYVAEGRL